MTVQVFGIRHHGPGSARSLLAGLAAYEPDCVLIEGPADADPLLHWAIADEMEPPLALLGYAPDEPKVAAFWPYADFSPEWQAMRWALQRQVELGFCDLPAANTLAATEPRPRRRRAAGDPLGLLAETAGYDDAERWWEDLVESRLDGSSPFPLITEAMAELRAVMEPPDEAEATSEARREAYMRQTIRAALKRGRERIAVVCGAWHAPVLVEPLPPAVHDQRTLRGMPKRKVTLTWVPWTHQRLASATGYGAGITSPGWYGHLWSAPDRPIVRWLTKVAQALRRRDLATSSAHVIEAVRLAETLASLRGRPLAGLAEVTEATRAVLCDGDELAVRYVTDELVVGQRIGSVNPGVPTVPLEADLLRTCTTLRIRREARVRAHDLDLRRSIDQARSRLFHRLRVLEIGWIVPARSSVQSTGTFRETWQSCWQPEFSVALVEAAVWGTTVEAAAGARLERIAREGTLLELTEAVETSLLAEVPAARDLLLTALADRAALDADVVHLMDALPPLARAQRYGDVRQSDTAALLDVAEALLLRICAGLPTAISGLDEENAVAMRRRIDAVHAALGLLGESEGIADLRERWLATLDGMLDRAAVHGQISGRVVRLLFDAERLADVGVRVDRALSHGVGAADKAAWVDGFFADGALLLIHDNQLRALLDGWLTGLAEPEFVDVLPLVRRTFGTFSGAERRLLAGRLAASSAAAEAQAKPAYDLDRAAAALATVDLILGGAR